MNITNIINENALRTQVPSVFSMEAGAKTSEKYALIPTIECIRGLQKEGFYPVKAEESRCRNADNAPFVKHMIRFRREGNTPVGGMIPEIVMLNSHDGTSAYQLRAGIYRLICSNGLIVGNDLFHRSIRHQGDVISKVVESAAEIIEIIPKAIEVAGKWKDITLNDEQRKIYADSASLLKWDKEETSIQSERLLLPKRPADVNKDLWTTFNVIQENLIKGGVRYYNSEARRRGTTRGVKSVTENSRLNTALWNLTEKMETLLV